MALSREQLARRAAKEVETGTIVNLGIGSPLLVPDFLEEGAQVWFQSENGILGMGPFPTEAEVDAQIINAGKQTVTILRGGSTFDSTLSFAMIRGGHVDLAILGTMQVSQNGDLANWAVPGGKTTGIGGAMDLASGVKRIVVVTRHTTKKGEPKLLEDCSYPLTAQRCVDRIITDLGVLDVTPEGFKLVELSDGVTLEELRDATGAEVVA
ncbi:MAG: CoA transferase subunit B [Chloroflexi bacterium]|nr:CoA transferase subunit B [Chloroflexota bacterium]